MDFALDPTGAVRERDDHRHPLAHPEDAFTPLRFALEVDAVQWSQVEAPTAQYRDGSDKKRRERGRPIFMVEEERHAACYARSMRSSGAVAAQEGEQAFADGATLQSNPYRCSSLASLVAQAADVAWRSAWLRQEARHLRSEALDVVLRSQRARVSYLAANGQGLAMRNHPGVS
jgi:hypothetical protein